MEILCLSTIKKLKSVEIFSLTNKICMRAILQHNLLQIALIVLFVLCTMLDRGTDWSTPKIPDAARHFSVTFYGSGEEKPAHASKLQFPWEMFLLFWAWILSSGDKRRALQNYAWWTLQTSGVLEVYYFWCCPRTKLVSFSEMGSQWFWQIPKFATYWQKNCWVESLALCKLPWDEELAAYC